IRLLVARLIASRFVSLLFAVDIFPGAREATSCRQYLTHEELLLSPPERHPALISLILSTIITKIIITKIIITRIIIKNSLG
ncbi:hypothetical protein ACLKA6_016052, partial [Drosophila palustris]